MEAIVEDHLTLFRQLFHNGEIEIKNHKEKTVCRGVIGEINLERGKLRLHLMNFEIAELDDLSSSTPNNWRRVSRRAYTIVPSETSFSYLPSHVSGVWAGIKFDVPENCHSVKLILPNHVGRNPFTTHTHDVHSEHQ